MCDAGWLLLSGSQAKMPLVSVKPEFVASWWQVKSTKGDVGEARHHSAGGIAADERHGRDLDPRLHQRLGGRLRMAAAIAVFAVGALGRPCPRADWLPKVGAAAPLSARQRAGRPAAPRC